jgi:predicted extracellular nuclease
MFRILAFVLSMAWTCVVAADEFTIATFNTEFLTRPKVHMKFGFKFNLSDESASIQQAWAQPGFRDLKFSEAAAAVAKVIADIDADLIVLVEVGDETDVNELNAAIAAEGVSYPHVEVCTCTDHTTQQHVAVLSKVSLSDVQGFLPGRATYYEELDDSETENDTGISKGLKVTFQAEGETFNLFGVHLASERGGHEQDEQRIAQATIVRRLTVPLLNADEHVIVAGDLNDYRGQPALRRIRGLDDIWPDLIQTGHHEYFEADERDTRWTYEFRGVRNQIDHILLSRSIRNLTGGGGIKPSVPGQDDELASDHRAFVLVLDLP